MSDPTLHVANVHDEAQAALRATDIHALLTKGYHLTHRMHASTDKIGEDDARAQRDLITEEIVRRVRLAEASQ